MDTNTKYKYGDIILFRPTGLIGELIVGIDSKGLGHYSHVGVFITYLNGVPLFMEAHEKNKRGIAILKLEEWGNFDIYRPTIKPRPISEALSLLGNSYDSARLFAIAMLRIFGKKIRPDNSDKMICAEVPNYIYNYRLLVPGYETPWEWEKLAQKNIIIPIYKSKTML